jgi:hypothetical protein
VDAVRKEFARQKPKPTAFRAESEPDDFMPDDEAEAAAPARPTNLELHLLKLLFTHDDLVAWLTAHLDVNWLVHPLVRQMVTVRLAAQEQGTWRSLTEFLDGCDSPEQRSLITEAVADERPLPNPPTQLADVTLKLRNHFLDRQIADLTVKINQGLLNDAEKQVWLNLRTQRRQPLAPLVK